MKNKTRSNYKKYGEQMYASAEELFPICRSLTGNGVRKTLKRLKEIMRND